MYSVLAGLVVPERPLIPLGIEHSGPFGTPFGRLRLEDAGRTRVDCCLVHRGNILRVQIGAVADGAATELRLLELLAGSTDHHDRVPEPELCMAQPSVRVGPGEQQLEAERFEPGNRPLRVAVPELREKLRQGRAEAIGPSRVRSTSAARLG